MAKASLGRTADVCRNISLVLAGCLPFLIPFDVSRNIDLQGSVLMIAGGLAWGALLLSYGALFRSLDRSVGGLLAVFAASCTVSLLVNPHFGYDLFGAPYIRLGTAGLLSCMGIGLLLTTVPAKRLLDGLYLIILTLSVVSVPYSLWNFHSLWRFGGLFSQADVMACSIGCGLLLGLEMLCRYPQYRKLLWSAQLFWLLLLVLSETRAVLLLVMVLGLAWKLQRRRNGKAKLATAYVVASLILLAGLHYLAPSRLTSTAYASQSISYRLTLQDYALKASWHKPILGYGSGNLADALSCSRLPAGALQKTCNQGYFFNSSHNIFIDRVLSIGWLGGLSYLVIVLLAIYRGLSGEPQMRIFGYVLLLIAGYYLTNVTSVTLELLLWILLLGCLHPNNQTLNKP